MKTHVKNFLKFWSIMSKTLLIFVSLFSYENTKSIPLHLQNHTWHNAAAEQHLYLGRHWFMPKIKCICQKCGKEFYKFPSAIKNGRSKYCSRKCLDTGRIGKPLPKKGKEVECIICRKKMYRMKSFQRKNNYCSRECQFKGMKKQVTIQCDECKNMFSAPQSRFKWNKIRGHKHTYCSKNCQDIAASKKVGKLAPSYIDGRSINNKRIRKGIEWKRWRRVVFERDNYTCQVCGARSSKGNPVELHPHHIKRYSKYPELRFDINNGLTVCVSCHKKIHSKKGVPVKILFNEA